MYKINQVEIEGSATVLGSTRGEDWPLVVARTVWPQMGTSVCLCVCVSVCLRVQMKRESTVSIALLVCLERSHTLAC